MTKKIKPCLCGGNKTKIDWSPVSEYKNSMYQSYTIYCLNCDVDVSFNVNVDKKRCTNHFESHLISLWNLINTK